MADSDIETEHRDINPDPARGRDPHATTRPSESARQVGKQAKQDTRETLDKARNQVQSMLAEQKQSAAGQVEGLARALRKTAEQLDAQDQSPVARYVERAAERLDQLGGTLRDRDIESLAMQVQDFARRQPGVFLGGAVAAGFLVARFLKSSSPSAQSSAPSSSPSDEPYAGTSTDEPSAGASHYSQPGSTSESVSTPT
jgi:hypothetical protein